MLKTLKTLDRSPSQEVKKAGYTFQQLRAGGFTVEQLRHDGFKAISARFRLFFARCIRSDFIFQGAEAFQVIWVCGAWKLTLHLRL